MQICHWEQLLLKTPLRVGWLDWAREALAATLAAQILALPLILYHFGNLSIIAPLANIILLPMVPCVRIPSWILYRRASAAPAPR